MEGTGRPLYIRAQPLPDGVRGRGIKGEGRCAGAGHRRGSGCAAGEAPFVCRMTSRMAQYIVGCRVGGGLWGSGP